MEPTNKTLELGMYIRPINKENKNMGIALIGAMSFSGIVAGDGQCVMWKDVEQHVEVSEDKGVTWTPARDYKFPEFYDPREDMPRIHHPRN